MRRFLALIAVLLFVGNTLNVHDHEFREMTHDSNNESYGNTSSIDLGMIALHATHPPCQTHQGHSSSPSPCCCHHSMINGLTKNSNSPEGKPISLIFFAWNKHPKAPIIDLTTPPPRFT